RVATVVVVAAAALVVAVAAAAATAAAGAVVTLVVVAAVMAAVVIAATAVAAVTVAVAPPATAVVIRSGSTQASVHRSPAAASPTAVARLMAIKPTATLMPGSRTDTTRAAVRATTHGVLTETATARVTDTAGRGL
ncbi:MAG TPA: hypothetical protein VH209_10755, partial [Steroidobacteraceae bacterium]|nr:hypothetical protein [Steroidobacteraceae bacterium]